MRFLFTFFILSTISIFELWSQDIKITVKAPETVIIGEQFRIVYSIESKIGIVKEPIIIKNMEDFPIIYGPSFSASTSSSFKNGKREVIYISSSTYFVEAEKTGKYTLPAPEIKYNRKKYRSDIVKIEVKNPPTRENEGEKIDAFIKTITSKNNVNLSDTLTLSYEIYSTKEIDRIISLQLPIINDFYTVNITSNRQNFKEKFIDGKKYFVAELRKLILQPKATGQFMLPEGKATVQYIFPTGRTVNDFWGNIYEETISSKKNLTIEPLIIRVQDLKAL